MTAYHSFWEVIKAWFHSADFNKFDTLYGIRFLWLSRSGQLLQFLASLTIIAEIIGKENITDIRIALQDLINLKKAFYYFISSTRLIKSFKNVRDWNKPNVIFDTYSFPKPPIQTRQRTKVNIYLPLYLLLPFFYLIYFLILLVLLSLCEMFLFPVIVYLSVSEKEVILKLISFILILIGFSMSLIFS